MKKREFMFILMFFLVIVLPGIKAFEFCEDGVVGEDNLRIISVDDMEIENPVEWQWQTSEQIEIEVRVQNKDDKTKNYKAELVFVLDGKEKTIVEDEDDLIKEIELSAGERDTILFKFEIDEDTEEDEYEVYVKFYKSGDEDTECVENSEEKIKISKIEICEDGNVDESDLKINYVKDEEDGWVWEPSQEVEIKVEAQNKDYEDKEYYIELIFLDENREEVNLADEESDLKKEISLEEDETDDVTFIFDLKKDIKGEYYYVYAKLYSMNDNDICTSLKAERTNTPKKIKIKREDNKVVVSSVSGPTELSSGQAVSYNAKILNIGENDEEKVKVSLYNSVLNISIDKEINNLKSGEEKEITFSFNVPKKEIKDTKSILYFSTEFEYDSKKEIYKEFSNEDEELEYKVDIKYKEVSELTENTTEPEDNTVIEDIVKQNQENKTIEEDLIINDSEEIKTTITGGAVGTNEGNNKGIFLIVIVVAFLFLVLIFFIYQKTKSREKIYKEHYANPQITRKYTARLHD